MTDTHAIASELASAFAARKTIAPPTSRDAGFDLAAAYSVESELARRRRADGRSRVGVKVGYANKAVWRALKLDTLVWARMYDDTVRFAGANEAALSLERMIAPKLEPEIVFRLRAPLGAGVTEAAAALRAVEWIALGFEIVDCPYPDWKLAPADFVAAYGLHAALVVGEPHAVTASGVPALIEQLPLFKVRLSRDGQVVAEGSGRNSLRSPALCLAELASAMVARGDRLETGDLISSGTLTESTPIHPGATWTAMVDGLDLPALTLHV